MEIDYLKLSNCLCNPSECVGLYYYSCMPESDNPNYSESNKFIESLKKIPKFEVKLGRLQRVRDKHYYEFHEKGADVMLAVDLVQMSLEKKINHAIIITGDSDFVYAINIAKKAGVSIELYYLPPVHHDLLNAVDYKTRIDNSWLLNKCKLV